MSINREDGEVREDREGIRISCFATFVGFAIFAIDRGPVAQSQALAVAGAAWLASNSARLRPMRIGSTPCPCSTSIVL
jgi:hypothetical protein